jgi:hypothetical protein
MISLRDEQYVREKAYVPEHIVPLMTGLSHAEPFLREDHLLFVAEDWMIFIGYPLGGEFREKIFTRLLEKGQEEFHPATTWFIAPRIPENLRDRLRRREADDYYRLDLPLLRVKRSLEREVEKASRSLQVEKNRAWSREHAALTREFLEKENLNPRVRELYLRMDRVLAHSETSLALSARDSKGLLAAFFVLELGAQKFATYVVGCYSQNPYVPHASDLLFHEMISLAREEGKEFIHLGLGVNEGIRRFKRKWGGVPFLRYEFGEISSRPRGPLSWLQALQNRL